MHKRILFALALIIASALLFAYALTADAQDYDCDLSGAATLDIQRYNPRAWVVGGHRIPRHGVFVSDDILRAPEVWTGASTWVGYDAGGLTAAHLEAERFAALWYYDANGNALHWVEIKADADALYVMIMPAGLRDGIYAHGCAAFAVERGGIVETWLDGLAG